MDEQLKSNLTSSTHWLRLVYMILFAIFLQVASVVMTVLVVVQFLFALVTGNDNTNLRKFGDALSMYIFSVLQFLIYNSEQKPFPFSDWPESKVSTETEDSVQSSTESAAAKPKPRSTRKKVTKEPTAIEENKKSEDPAE